jgi:hypothetical protein
MKGDFIVRYNDDKSLFKIDLDFKTHHRIIRGFDVFVYNRKQRGKSHGWVCIDATTGSCADNAILGHKTKEEAFESAEKSLERYTDEMIIKAQQKFIKLGTESGIKYKRQGNLGDWI